MTATKKEVQRLLLQIPYLLLQNVIAKCCRSSYFKAILIFIVTVLAWYTVVSCLFDWVARNRTVTVQVQLKADFERNRYTPSIEITSELPHRREESKDNITERTLQNIEKCMQASNLDNIHLLQRAKQNAELFVTQYRQVIPNNYLPDHASHCWESDYNISLTQHGRVRGSIDNDNNRQVPNERFGKHMLKDLRMHFSGQGKHMLKDLRMYISGTFTSSKVCLPNIYLLGFEKSGSTFLWCVLTKVLNYDLKRTQLQAVKEPYFWTPYSYRPSLPHPENLAGSYIPMFLRAFDPKYPSENVTIIDGCPSTVLEWPRFHPEDPDIVNYCLLPSALPELFPQSKYLVIMRNPVHMLYSAFWWSYQHAPNSSSDPIAGKVRIDARKGPPYFHLRVKEKIANFLTCVNNHSSVKSKPKCELWGSNDSNFSACIAERTHLLADCVANITNHRQMGEAVLHRGMYYVHVLKWLQTVPRDRIVFTTLERLSNDVYSTIKEVYGIIQKDTVFPLDKETVKEISQTCKENTNIINYKEDSTLKMRLDTEYMLEQFFSPFNKMLSDLLGDEQFLWKKLQG